MLMYGKKATIPEGLALDKTGLKHCRLPIADWNDPPIRNPQFVRNSQSAIGNRQLAIGNG